MCTCKDGVICPECVEALGDDLFDTYTWDAQAGAFVKSEDAGLDLEDEAWLEAIRIHHTYTDPS
jgi:HD superfamily phosphohydrolase YqeK